jgi:hypothetical protein
MFSEAAFLTTLAVRLMFLDPERTGREIVGELDMDELT